MYGASYAADAWTSSNDKTLLTVIAVVLVAAAFAAVKIYQARAAASKDGYRVLLEQISERQGQLVGEINDIRVRLDSMEKMMREVE
ncbi:MULTISPECIES: hypothetical protein [unclassified Streptomyces]|uniref:hypothetical protein n=1 Tax=unclassified Streptomyces TaxID=2593676 RepID=UPI002DD8D840|nr:MULTISPECIES: hypothetical protein [unclassified Streptomyces]WRZ56523.1 hypothetical protein OG534_08545 [Streptomyces sp. NBC_01294]WSR14137.1 hypothetical protein OG457_13340 [Streptomyces sp. NBC_01207]WTA18050.1 hypothetical protein OG365_08240 [Streptomyces sp. NBC_00853]